MAEFVKKGFTFATIPTARDIFVVKPPLQQCRIQMRNHCQD